MKKSNLKKLTVSNFSSSSRSGKLIFISGIRFEMRSGTASGKHLMCRYRRTMVGIGTGIHRITDP